MGFLRYRQCVSLKQTRPKFGLRAQARRAGGFTIVEMLVASVVTTTALLGVYQLCSHALEAESRTAVQWNDLEAARSVADVFERALVSCVRLEGIDALAAQPSGDGGRELVCQTSDCRVRLSWTGGGPAAIGVRVSRQEMAFAGSQNLSLAEGIHPVGVEAWRMTPAETIATNIDEISVQFRPAVEQSKPWAADWKPSDDQDVLAWTQVRRGEQTADRMVWIRATGALTDSGGQ